MSKIIVYQTDDSQLCIVFPIEDCGLSINEIAKKDVPKGKPYKILPITDLPPNMEFSAAWEIDMSEPDGIGIGHEEWFATRGKI